MTVVTRRKLFTHLTHEPDGTVSNIEVVVEYTQDNDLNPSLNLVQHTSIQITAKDDMTIGDIAAATAFANRLEDMMERKKPLVEP